VRYRAQGAPLGTHLAYLRREGVTKDGAPGRMFDVDQDDADCRAFAERFEGDDIIFGSSSPRRTPRDSQI